MCRIGAALCAETGSYATAGPFLPLALVNFASLIANFDAPLSEPGIPITLP